MRGVARSPRCVIPSREECRKISKSLPQKIPPFWSVHSCGVRRVGERVRHVLFACASYNFLPLFHFRPEDSAAKRGCVQIRPGSARCRGKWSFVKVAFQTNRATRTRFASSINSLTCLIILVPWGNDERRVWYVFSSLKAYSAAAAAFAVHLHGKHSINTHTMGEEGGRESAPLRGAAHHERISVPCVASVSLDRCEGRHLPPLPCPLSVVVFPRIAFQRCK